MAKSILLVGGNFVNKGAEAMLKTVRSVIESDHPGSQYYAIVTEAQAEVAREEGFIPLFPPQESAILMKLRYYGNAIMYRLAKFLPIQQKPFADITPLGSMRREIDQLDLAVDVSGYAYHDGRGYRQPYETIKAMDFAAKKGAKYVFMPQAWGSFESPDLRKAMKAMMAKADDFYTRDTVSRRYMAELLGVAIDEIKLCPDIAFALPLPAAEIGEKLLQSKGYEKDSRPLVAISPNMRVYSRFKGDKNDHPYLQHLEALIKHLISKYQARIVLVPNDIYPGQKPVGEDDRYLCRVLYQRLNKADSCFLFDEFLSTEQVKSVVGQCDFLVGSRFHSLVFALGQGVPAMAISWSHKYRELFRLFDMEKYVVEDQVIELSESVRLLDDLIGNKEKLQNDIKMSLVEINEKLSQPLQTLRQAMR